MDTSIDIDLHFVERKTHKKSTPEDRKNFIEFMFNRFHEIQSKSNNDLSQKLVNLYETENGVKIGKVWVYRILRLGPIKHRDGTYGFKMNVGFTMEELCETPSLTERIDFTK